MKILDFQTDISTTVLETYLIASNNNIFIYVSVIDDDHWFYEVSGRTSDQRKDHHVIFRKAHGQIDMIGDIHDDFFEIMEALQILVPDSVINTGHLNEMKSIIQNQKSVPKIEI